MSVPYFSKSDIDFYHGNGYLVFDPAFPNRLIAQAREDILEMLGRIRARLSLNDKRIRETETDLHLKSPAVRELIASDAFAEVCRIVLGDDIDLRFCFTLTKTAEHGGPIQWHQDWGLDKDRGHPRITFWIAITDSDLGNGCIRIIPGSHRMEIQPHTVSEDHPPDLGIRHVETEKAIPLEMKAGQVLLIHPQVIHGSDCCASRNPRIAVLGSYQVPKKAYDERWAKAGAKFLRQGKKAWGPLEASLETRGDGKE